MKNLKKNNKGFSLVELIVVMAIMAILAVTLTPRLTQYIDKARQTNDREIPNAVFTATRLGLLDDTIQKSVNTQNALTGVDDYDWATGVDVLDVFYTQGTGDDGDLYTVIAPETQPRDLLAEEIISTLGNSFRFQSNLADEDNAVRIEVSISNVENQEFTVEFQYGSSVTGQYTMDTAAVR